MTVAFRDQHHSYLCTTVFIFQGEAPKNGKIRGASRMELSPHAGSDHDGRRL